MTEPSGSDNTKYSYKDAGVDIDAANRLVERIKGLAASTARPGADGALGGFGGAFDLKATGYRDPILIAANDGVGTKLRIAIDAGIHDTVGIDLVAMCVNDLVVQGAEPLFFLDYFACGALDEAVAEAVISGIAEGCRQAGATLIGGETAEMPGMYAENDYDLAGFTVGAVERSEILPREDIVEGDIVIGLPSSGLHSNGFSLVRRIVADRKLSYADAAPFDSAQSLGQALLVPTRIYVASVLGTIKATGAVKGLAHITGGGFIENIPRVLPLGLGVELDAGAINVPPVFAWLADDGAVATREMATTFNCGIGMVLITAPADAQSVADRLADGGEAPVELGVVTDATDTGRVKIKGSFNI